MDTIPSKRLVWFATLVLLLIPASSSRSSTVFEVRPDQNLQKTIDLAQAGSTVILLDGTHQGPVRIEKPITLRAKHPGKAVVSNRYAGQLDWKPTSTANRIWKAEGLDWPISWMLVEGQHAFDYRTKLNFDERSCGPFWSKGWQTERTPYPIPPISFTRDAGSNTLWLRLDDDRDPNRLRIDINKKGLTGRSRVQKDLGTHWNQQQTVLLDSSTGAQRITMWYEGTPENPAAPKHIDYPAVCGIAIDINADNVLIEGLRIHLAPTVGIEVNNSKAVTIRNCYLSGFQFGISSGYECESLTVEHCEFDGGSVVSKGGHRSVNLNMWCHSTYIIPVKFYGVGLSFKHNYVYEGYDLFHPRGRHKNYPHVPDLRSEVAYNVWQTSIDNALEFDGVEARMNLRFHHNLILSDHDPLAITTTENGGPLTIDHNIWWPGGNRIMKLVGTNRENRGVIFAHNTYFAGERCNHNTFTDSRFENNIVISNCRTKDCWTPESLGSFFPTPNNLLYKGDRYTKNFTGLTANPLLGSQPDTLFVLSKGSPAIDAGAANSRYNQENVFDHLPDLGALEAGESIEDWRRVFGHCGPTWITSANASIEAPNRPLWPTELDPRWGGLD